MNRVLRASRLYQLICSVSVSICTSMYHFADMCQCPTHRCRSTSLPKGLSGTRIPPAITYEPPPITTAFPEEINCPVCDPVSGIRDGRARVPDQLQPRLRVWFNNTLERNGVASKNQPTTLTTAKRRTELSLCETLPQVRDLLVDGYQTWRGCAIC